MSAVSKLADTRAKVFAIQDEMAKHEQLDIPIVHYFAKGVYAREMTMPAGSIVVGKIHKYSQINILSKGEISVLTEEGMKRVQAPFTLVAGPGVKRAMYAHTECVWTVFHGTDETDVETIESQFIAQDERGYLAFCAQLEEK